jgi:excisionase family DNA binding protein
MMDIELNSRQAAALIGISQPTIIRNVRRGTLAARMFGLKGTLRIKVSELRRFAAEYGYTFNDELLATILGRVE